MNRRTFGIRQRVLIITLLPLCMITLLLGGYFINTRLADAQSALIEKGQTMTQMMASSAEFGLLVGNTEILQGLIRSATKAAEIDDVIFLNPAFSVLARGNRNAPTPDKDAGYPLFKNNQVHFLHPVIATGVDILDAPDLTVDEPEPEFIGWVVIVLSQKPTQERQFEILTKGIVLALIGLLGTLFIASRFGQRITNPILGLTHVIEMLQHGHLETRASLSSTGELRSLAQGINRLAQRVQESNQTLESRVDKATKRLRSTLVHLEKQNQALDRSKKRADSANLAKDEFLARMSHELRTPLTSVSGFARLLNQTELKTEQKEYTRIINLTSELLLSIIDDILDYSKLESNAIELEDIPFEFEACIYDVIEMQTATAHEKGLELIPIIDPKLPRFLVGDPVRLRQILTNLVSNAVKFTSQGQVTLYTSLLEQDIYETKLKIVIEDSGTGIPKERLDNLFKAFSQADTSITRKYGGSGLGLVIAKRLTELMSGEINLDSREGAGTRVELSIPFASARQRVSTTRNIGEVIIFDDNPLVRQSLVNQITNYSHLLSECFSFDEFEHRVKNNPGSAILWGLETNEVPEEKIAQIKTFAEKHSNKLILLSGQPLPIILPGNVTQLRKPPRTQLLLNALAPWSYNTNNPQKEESIQLRKSPTILVAEDNDFNRLLIRKILQQANAKVIEARNGEEALRLALKQPLDLILMDVHMPVMDGIEATQKIRMSHSELPILALTANVISSEHKRLTDAGVNHVLLKPINDVELCQTIDKYIKSSATLDSTQMEHTQSITELAKYDIEQSALDLELHKQLEGLKLGFRRQDIKIMRHHSHQLTGIAGLYQIPELELVGAELHDALLNEHYRAIWRSLWQLQRVVEHQQYESSETF
ncbi:ATP-binding protein [uncultured Neptuniibacter sp.]|uniref:ATP-binding protein n=1 Tax=uncultured Neptuniibacter sp. TaxID=502143 RepID=UPI0026165E4F|nr:ATP-binding protein [uncultured Neptuniibacter sp.]